MLFKNQLYLLLVFLSLGSQSGDRLGAQIPDIPENLREYLSDIRPKEKQWKLDSIVMVIPSPEEPGGGAKIIQAKELFYYDSASGLDSLRIRLDDFDSEGSTFTNRMLVKKSNSQVVVIKERLLADEWRRDKEELYEYDELGRMIHFHEQDILMAYERVQQQRYLGDSIQENTSRRRTPYRTEWLDGESLLLEFDSAGRLRKKTQTGYSGESDPPIPIKLTHPVRGDIPAY